MQHRKVYIDDWNLLEKACLVSAVLRYGDSNWSSICEFIKPRLQENRPWDWFTPEACEAQYKILNDEVVKTQDNGENPVLQIIQNLKTKCKLESQRKEEQWNKYMSCKKKLEHLLKNEEDSDLIDKYYEDVLREKKEREENVRKYQEALKKRELLKSEFEKISANRTPNKQETKADGGSSPVVTSPLLSSLLNNPPAVQYRPTLSTGSFIPTKATQSTSRSTSFEKNQSFNDSTLKDNAITEISDQPRTPECQPVASSSAVKKLEFQESVSSTSRTPISDVTKIQSVSTEPTPKSEAQSLDNLALISPNEEVYLSEVDIPPEALLEVIGDLKEGTISLDKLIRDLEATDEGVIIDKEDLTNVTVPMDQSYDVQDKPIEQIPIIEQPATDIKTEINDETENQLQSQEKSNEHENSLKEQVVIVEDDKNDHERHTPGTDDIANIEISSSDSNVDPPVKEGSPVSTLSFSSTVAISVELESSFSEQKSDTEVVESTGKLKRSESEIDEEKSKNSKPVVVIKRIEDGNYFSKNRRKKISLEEVKDDVDSNESKESEQATKPEPIDQYEFVQEEKPLENQIQTVDENVTIEKSETDGEQEKPSEKYDSDASDKFEDALQSHDESETHTEENIANIEIEDKSSSYAEIDESFDLNVTVDKDNTLTEESQSEEKSETETLTEDKPSEPISETDTLEVPEKESVENISLTDYKFEDEKESVEEECKSDKKSDDVKPAPTKIIKKYGRKRKSTSESIDSGSEISIQIPPVVLKEIETLDSEIEQTFTPVRNIKVEPSDTKSQEERKEQNEDSIQNEKPRTRENTPSKIKQEKRETKTPERKVVKVLRKFSGKTQTPLRRTERESRSMDNSELDKTRKKTILLEHSRLMSHKYSNAFLKPITNRQVPGYDSIIYKPMDLYTIKKKVETKQINSVAEFQRDVLLMLNNAKMFNRINSQVYNMAVEFEEYALPNIQLTVETLGEGILRKVEQTNEKNRKRQSLDNAKKDLKLIKRIKCSTKDDSFTTIPLKKPKLEENDGD